MCLTLDDAADEVLACVEVVNVVHRSVAIGVVSRHLRAYKNPQKHPKEATQELAGR